MSLEQTIAKGERELGRAMTEREKRSYMLNEVLTQGVKIHGAYEAAMETAGKQMTSLTRYWQEARNAIGGELMPEMRKAIIGLTELAKRARENADAIERRPARVDQPATESWTGHGVMRAPTKCPT